MTEWSEDHLADLLDAVRGEGARWWILKGPGLTTHPANPDADARRLHAGCLELERRGLVRRAACSTAAQVTWIDAGGDRGGPDPAV